MRRRWDDRRLAAIALGGIAGAGVRWAVVTSVEVGRFPWPVLALNVAGSLLLGALLAEEWDHPSLRLLLRDAGGIGFCGGLTTFSTFSVEVVELIRSGSTSVAVAYATATLLGTIGGVATGAGALHRLRAATLPLEEQP